MPSVVTALPLRFNILLFLQYLFAVELHAFEPTVHKHRYSVKPTFMAVTLPPRSLISNSAILQLDKYK